MLPLSTPGCPEWLHPDVRNSYFLPVNLLNTFALEESIRLAEPDPEGKIRLEKKSKHKERTGKSPDFFDSLLMRMIFEIKPSGGWG